MDPTLLRVSADGSLVLAVMAGPQQHTEDSVGLAADNEQLYLGVLGDKGVTEWVQRPLAPGLGEVSSPAWVDPDTIAFVGEAGTKGSMALWTVRLDGWDPTQVLASGRGPTMVDVADQLTVDPGGHLLVFKTSTDLSSSLWLVNLDGRGLRPLTSGSPSLDSDPSLAGG
jgi:Tol biopolymer transport system component